MLAPIMSHRILIVGGGFAGVTTALKLSKARLPDTRITILNDKTWLEYYGVLYRLLTHGKPAEACIPLSMILPEDVEVIVDPAVSADPARKTVTGKSGTTHAYDTLILAPGSEPAFFGIPGMKEHAMTMKSAADALALKYKARKIVEAMKAAPHAEKSVAENVAIVGAGPTGVEIAGDLLPYMRGLAAEAGLDPMRVRFHLIEAMDRVLPPVEPDASEKTLIRLHALGVDVHLKTAVASAEAGALTFKDGGRLEARLIVWTAGVKASSLLAAIPGLELDKRGRAVVDEQLRAKGLRDVFVLGDCASTPFAGMAQTAVEDALHAARVITASHAGKPLPVYHPKAPAYAIPAGPYWSAVKVGFIRAYGLFGYALRRAADIHVYMLILPWRHVLPAFFGTLPVEERGVRINHHSSDSRIAATQ
jgi:NADH:ubiquinone reductase (H+-translocating)